MLQYIAEKNYSSVHGSYKVRGILFSAQLSYGTNLEQANILMHVYMQDNLLSHSNGYILSVVAI